MDQQTSLAQYLRSATSDRWLHPEEIFLILSIEASQLGFVISASPPVNPQSKDFVYFVICTRFTLHLHLFIFVCTMNRWAFLFVH
jgi:hypothetical protein